MEHVINAKIGPLVKHHSLAGNMTVNTDDINVSPVAHDHVSVSVNTDGNSDDREVFPFRFMHKDCDTGMENGVSILQREQQTNQLFEIISTS